MYQADISGNFNRVNLEGCDDVFFVEDTMHFDDAKHKVS